MKLLKAIGMGAALLCASGAQAAVFGFELTGDYSASWEIDTDTGPFSSDPSGFTYAQVSGDFPGSGQDGVDIDFFDEASGGGLRLTDFEEGTILAWLGGALLFEGDTAAPRFRAGSFSLTGMGGEAGTLVIRDLSAAAVPEPATWAMMIGGFALTGAALRRRTSARRAAA